MKRCFTKKRYTIEREERESRWNGRVETRSFWCERVHASSEGCYDIPAAGRIQHTTQIYMFQNVA